MIQTLALVHAVKCQAVGDQCQMPTLYTLAGKRQHCTSLRTQSLSNHEIQTHAGFLPVPELESLQTLAFILNQTRMIELRLACT